jgi:glutamyl-tRNA reductase
LYKSTALTTDISKCWTKAVDASFGILGAFLECEFLAERALEPTLIIVGLDHRTAPIDVRERFWIGTPAQRSRALTALSHSEGIEEAFVFSTCHRTEFVLWGDPTLAPNSALRFLASHYDLKLCEWTNFYRLLEDKALAHAFAVSCELDSQYVGEGHIARQVNTAWQQARECGSTGCFLNAVLRTALAVRRRVRKETTIADQTISVPNASVSLARKILGTLGHRRILLVGAGKLNATIARSLAEHGAGAVEIVGRTDEGAVALAEKQEIRGLALSELWERMIYADLVISATSSPDYILTRDGMTRVASLRNGRQLAMIDLAMPRNVDPGVRSVEGLSLYDLDDLDRALIPTEDRREAEVAAYRIISEEVGLFKKQVGREAESPAVAALRHKLDEIFHQELDAFREEQGPFPKDQDQMIATLGERVTHRIAGSLSREKA